MKRWKHSVPWTATLLACAAMLIPAPCLDLARGEELRVTPTTPRIAFADAILDADGNLNGRVVNENGKSLAETTVELRQDQQTVAKATTDKHGDFKAGPLRGGVYQVSTIDSTYTLRLWTTDAAPPQAVAKVQLSQGNVVRAQGCSRLGCTIPGCSGDCGGFAAGPLGVLTHPLFIAAAVAAAIAIPLALDDDDAS